MVYMHQYYELVLNNPRLGLGKNAGETHFCVCIPNIAQFKTGLALSGLALKVERTRFLEFIVR